MKFGRNRRKGSKPGVPAPVALDLHKGDDARDHGRWAEAVQWYTRHLEAHPGDFGIWVQRGHAEKEIGDYAAAEQSYLSAMQINPADDDLWLQLGHLYKISRRLDEAEAAYLRSIEIANNQDASRELSSIARTRIRVSPGPLRAEHNEPAREPEALQVETKVRVDESMIRNSETQDILDLIRSETKPLARAALLRRILLVQPLEQAFWRELAQTFVALDRQTDAARCGAIIDAISSESNKQAGTSLSPRPVELL